MAYNAAMKNPHPRKHILLSLIAILICLNALSAIAAPTNVLFILVDDMGWTGPACYGSDLHETPNIDGLAAQGMRFTNAYAASPICSPTRASILSGKHPARLNMTTWHEAAVERQSHKGDKPLAPPLTEPHLGLQYLTLAELFKGAGYTTAHIGKWHLGDSEHYPEAQGFDINIGGTHWGAPRSFFYPYAAWRDKGNGEMEYRYVPGLGFGKEGDYLTDRLTDEALNVLDQVHDQPFFLHMAYHNPHTPIEGKPELVEYYKQKIKEGMTHNNATYAAMIHSLDENIGRLLAKLEEHHIADNTLVVFFSDNGGFDQVREGEVVTTQVPLRSGKGSLYEGGIRVPLIIKWPGITTANTTSDTPVISTDFYPTFMELLQTKSTQKIDALDGINLKPLLENSDITLDREDLFFHYPHYYFNTTPVTAIRSGDWKLIEYTQDNKVELYNLKDDLAESNNLAQTQGDRVKALQQKLHAWHKGVNAQFAVPNDEYKP